VQNAHPTIVSTKALVGSIDVERLPVVTSIVAVPVRNNLLTGAGYLLPLFINAVGCAIVHGLQDTAVIEDELPSQENDHQQTDQHEYL